MDEALRLRPVARRDDFGAEGETLVRLAQSLQSDPAMFHQQLVASALNLCAAHSSGLTVAAGSGASRILHWEAVAGTFAAHRKKAVAHSSSVCGQVLSARTVQLVLSPGAQFTDFGGLDPAVREVLCCPVFVEYEAVATLWVLSHGHERRFDPEDARRLTNLARLAAVGFQALETQSRNAQLYQSKGLHERRLNLLWKAAQVLLSAENADEMLSRLFREIHTDLDVDTYFNFMVNPQGDALSLASCTGIPSEAARKIHRLDFGQAICGAVAQNRVSIVATDIQTSDDPKVQLVRGFGIRAYACNPLMSGERLIGTLSFASHTRNFFPPGDLEFFRIISRYVAVAYERMQLIASLQSADRKKDEFIATLAHELRNPLAPIRSGIELIRDSRANESQREHAAAIVSRQVRTMVRLVDDLLEVSRITLGRLELRCEPVTLGSIMSQAVEATRSSMDAQGHTLEVILLDDDVVVHADATRLGQVFLNLLSNACKYTPRGGRITLSSQADEEEVRIAVRDNGIGIPSAMLRRIFDLFTQVDRSLGRVEGGGLGIGLWLAQRIVESHGGRLAVKSEGEGQGTEFLVSLPRAVEAPAKTATAPKLAVSGRRIVIVDDNKDAADSLSSLLEIEGHEVQVFYTATSGLTHIAQQAPHVLLLDIGLPDISGYEVCRQVRALPRGEAIRIIALTGWGAQSDRAKSRAAGFDHHCVKPVDPALLTDLLRTN